MNFIDKTSELCDMALKWSRNPGPNNLHAAIEKALRSAFEAGMMHTTVPRDRVSVHGTDGCLNCDTGRITIYAGHRWCLECQLKKERSNQENSLSAATVKAIGDEVDRLLPNRPHSVEAYCPNPGCSYSDLVIVAREAEECPECGKPLEPTDSHQSYGANDGG